MDVFEGCRCREKHARFCNDRRGSRRVRRSIAGVCCIFGGILVMICFVPGWLVAILAAFLLFSLGFYFIGAC